MNILLTILLAIVGIVVMLLIIGLFMSKDHYVKREIVINAPRQKVFDFLKLMKNQELYNKYAKADPERKEQIKGIDGTVGYTISWNGNKKVGEGQKEIMGITEGKRIETEIRFVRPMETRASVIMETDPLNENQTKVSMINAGTLKYPINIGIPLFEKMFAKDMDSSLVTLKAILEKQ